LPAGLVQVEGPWAPSAQSSLWLFAPGCSFSDLVCCRCCFLRRPPLSKSAIPRVTPLGVFLCLARAPSSGLQADLYVQYRFFFFSHHESCCHGLLPSIPPPDTFRAPTKKNAHGYVFNRTRTPCDLSSTRVRILFKHGGPFQKHGSLRGSIMQFTPPSDCGAPLPPLCSPICPNSLGP